MDIICVFDNNENRSLKPKRNINNGNIQQVDTVKKCLFGRADPGDTDKLLEEQRKNDRDRFKELFGFDIEDIENMENRRFNKVMKRPMKGKLKREHDEDRRVSKKKRKLFRNISQDNKITHFFKVKKCAMEGSEGKNQIN